MLNKNIPFYAELKGQIKVSKKKIEVVTEIGGGVEIEVEIGDRLEACFNVSLHAYYFIFILFF